MSAAAHTTQPEPQSSRSGRLLALVRKLIDYGKELAATLQQRTDAADLAPIMRSFGTVDIARILARIMYGLHRAHALQDRIVHSAARLDVADRKPCANRGATPSQPRATPATV